MHKAQAFTFGLILAFASPPTLAKKTPKKAAKNQAKKPKKKGGKGKKEFILGVRFFKAGEYDAALPLFRKAYELSGHRRSAVLALAQVERVLKLYDDAIAHYREYLAMDPPNAKKIRETIKLTQELLDSMGGTSRPEAPESLPPEQESVEAELSIMPKAISSVPQSNPALTQAPVLAEVKSSESSLLSSAWFWGVTAGLLIGGSAGAYFFWPSPDVYGGTRNIVARPAGD
jgi:tetratricopeptide (TPR) repeat protein